MRIGAYSAHAEDRIPSIFAIPYPNLIQSGIIWRYHPITGEHYIDWAEYRKALIRLRLTDAWKIMTEKYQPVYSDLGPLALTVEEFLAGRLR